MCWFCMYAVLLSHFSMVYCILVYLPIFLKKSVRFIITYETHHCIRTITVVIKYIEYADHVSYIPVNTCNEPVYGRLIAPLEYVIQTMVQVTLSITQCNMLLYWPIVLDISINRVHKVTCLYIENMDRTLLYSN